LLLYLTVIEIEIGMMLANKSEEEEIFIYYLSKNFFNYEVWYS